METFETLHTPLLIGCLLQRHSEPRLVPFDKKLCFETGINNNAFLESLSFS